MVYYTDTNNYNPAAALNCFAAFLLYGLIPCAAVYD